MLNNLKVKEFKGIKECERPIEFSKFNLLMGANNAGKSSILEALFLFPTPNVPLPLFGRDRFEVLEWLHGDLKAVIYRYSGVGVVECEVKNKTFSLELELEAGRRALKISIEKAPVSLNLREIAEALGGGLSEDELLTYVIFIPNSDEFRKNLARELANRWDEVEKTGAHVRLVDHFISKVVEDKFTEITLRRSEMVIRKELPGDVAYVRLSDVGDGIKRFLTSALWVEAIQPKVVLWDDLESSAHPSLINAIIEWLMSRDWQVVASTHSIDVLRELVVAEPKEAKVIQLRKSYDDMLSWKELSLDEVEDLINKGQDVRKLFRW